MGAVRLIAQLRVADGTAQEFVEAWRDHLAEVSKEPGCLQYDMFLDVNDPQQVALLEHWESREAFDVHWERERAQEGGPGVPSTNALLVPSRGAMFHTEIYERKRSEFVDDEWTVVPDPE